MNPSSFISLSGRTNVGRKIVITGAGVGLGRAIARKLAAEGETVIQVHGVGPWSIIYVNPADDPRNKGK